MAINYADKFAPKVDERFTNEALSTPAVNQDYEFVGVSTVKVYSVNTVALNDYTLSGTSRYGTPKDLENEVQEMPLSQDRSFTFVIDRKSIDDTAGQMEVGKALARQISEQVIPEVDKYRFGKIVAGADAGNVVTKAITKTNAYESVLDGQLALNDAKAPRVGRVLYVSNNFFKLIKLDESFKLETYKIHEDAPGISGFLVEGRLRYDAFVLNNKKKGIFVHKKA